MAGGGWWQWGRAIKKMPAGEGNKGGGGKESIGRLVPQDVDYKLPSSSLLFNGVQLSLL